MREIYHKQTDNKYRLCKQFDETVERIISACTVLTTEVYIKRHDRVCAEQHFDICKEIRVKLEKEHWYDRVRKSVEASHKGKVNILWNQQVQAERTIHNSKPDTIICDFEKGTCVLTDVAISGDRNVI